MKLMQRDSQIQTEAINGVALVRINTDRPRNELTLDAVKDLGRLFDAWHKDPPRAAVLTGRDDCFSAGLAIEDVVNASRKEFGDFVSLEYRCIRQLEEMPFVTVVALSGLCLGNATELALACDFRVATSDIRLGLPEVAMGFMAPAQRLVKFMSIQQARRILLQSHLLHAHKALDLDLIDEIVRPEELVSTALQRATTAAELPPDAVRLTKENLRREALRGRNHDQEETAAAIETFSSPECTNRMALYLKRQGERDPSA
ncbi:enoyl-CoA hydratase/carnithine racemase [Auritidibacter ignavus]|nr:enoyl-CoA hydratase/carnithine racemase [Auritidibacter ignavus]